MKRKLALGLAAAAALFLAAVVAVPLLFSGAVVERASAAATERLRGSLTIGGGSMSFLRSFPELSVRLDDVQLRGEDEFADVALAEVKRVDLVIDLGRLVRGRVLRVQGLAFEGVALDLRDSETGPNWDILKPSEHEADGAGAGGGLDLALDALEVEDLKVSWVGAPSGLAVRLEDVSHRSSGNLASTRFLWETSSRIGALHVTSGDAPRLGGVPVDIDVDLAVDQAARTLSIQSSDVALGELRLAVEGGLAYPEARPLRADLDIEARTPDLAALLALLPGLAEGSAKDMTAGGEVTLSGSIHGPLGGENLPAVSADVTVRDGTYAHAHVHERVTALQLEAHLESPGPTLDGAILDVSRFSVQVADNPLQGSIRLAHPESSLDVKASAVGRVDLATLGRLLPSADGGVARGTLHVDVDFEGSVRDLSENPERAARRARGAVEFHDLAYTLGGADTPLQVQRGKLLFTPRRVEVEGLAGQAGESKVRLDGQIENLFGRLLLGEELVARLDVNSESIDLDELLAAFPRESPAGDATPAASPTAERRSVRVPEGYDLTLRANIDRVAFRELELARVRGDARIHSRRLDLSGLSFEFLDGGVRATGVYDSALDEPRIDLDLDIDRVDLTAAVETLDFVGKLAPLASATTGRISSDLKLGGHFDENMVLIIDTLGGSGGLAGHGLTVAGSEVMKLAAAALNDKGLEALRLSPVALDFRLDEGRLSVEPFAFDAGPLPATFEGDHELRGALNYRLTLEMPAARLAAEGESVLDDLLARSPFRGTRRAELPKTIPVIVGIVGTVAAPRVVLDLGSMGKAVAETVVEDVVEWVEEQVRKVDEAAKAEAERGLAAAKGLAEEARLQAKRGAKRLKQQAYGAADKTVQRASGILAASAARIAADAARKQADRLYRDSLRAADRRFDEALKQAREGYDDAIEAATEVQTVKRRRPATRASGR